LTLTQHLLIVAFFYGSNRCIYRHLGSSETESVGSWLVSEFCSYSNSMESVRKCVHLINDHNYNHTETNDNQTYVDQCNVSFILKTDSSIVNGNGSTSRAVSMYMVDRRWSSDQDSNLYHSQWCSHHLDHRHQHLELGLTCIDHHERRCMDGLRSLDGHTCRLAENTTSLLASITHSCHLFRKYDHINLYRR